MRHQHTLSTTEPTDINILAPSAARDRSTPNANPAQRAWWTWPITLLAAIGFASSGIFAAPLQDLGWSAGAITFARVAGGATILLIPGLIALRGQFHEILNNKRTIILYSAFAVVGTQLCFFQAIRTLDIGIALLIEYCSPLLIVLWMWARHGRRPTWFTIAGAAIAVIGLLLVLDVNGATTLDPVGMLWAAGAAIGVSGYYLISASATHTLPPISLVALGMTISAIGLAIMGLIGILPMTFHFGTGQMGDLTVTWWQAAIGLGLLSCATAYGAGILSARQLGSTLAGFAAYIELGLAFGLAWLLLGQQPSVIQGIGAIVLLIGVILVKLAEDRRA